MLDPLDDGLGFATSFDGFAASALFWISGGSSMKVAFVGLGSMGRPQARLIARAGHSLSVFDAAGTAMEPFRDAARLARSAEDAARDADVACVCVRDDRQLEEVVLGPAGLLAGLAPGALLLVHSTVRIDTLVRLEQTLAARQVALVDAPVTRTRPTDDEPFVLTMLGGDPEPTRHARELVAAFSTAIEDVGPLGSAMALKISNNLVSWVHIVVAGLAVEIASHYDVPVETLERVMQANGNLTPTVGGLLRGSRPGAPGANPERAAFLESQAGIGEKDVALAIECGRAAGADMAFAEHAQRRIRAAMTGRGAATRP